MDENPYKSPEEENNNEEERFIVEYQVDHPIAIGMAVGLFLMVFAVVVFRIWIPSR